MGWTYKRFGTLAQPIHKSDLVEITHGDYGCPRRFRFAMDELADNGGVRAEPSTIVHAKTAAGSAVHETLARALTNERVLPEILAGKPPSREAVHKTFEHEFYVATEGRDIDWGKEDAGELVDERVTMVHSALAELHRHVKRVVLVEAGFAVALDGIQLAGHVDLVYEPTAEPGTLGLADWKTGSQKPDSIELDHGWEAGIYSLALARGTFLRRDAVTLAPHESGGWSGRCHTHDLVRATKWQAERDALEAGLGSIAAGETVDGALSFGQFPSRLHMVHLGDYVPYAKAGKKTVKRREDCEHYGLQAGTEYRFKAGERRGPAWLPIARKETDIPRLQHRLRTVVGTVRMGRFFDLVGERCNRCRFEHQCLNTGYAPVGDELRELEATLKGAGL